MTADLWSHVSFALAPGWEELPADPKRIDAPGWLRWATDGFPDDGEPGDFAWMEGLVPPETRALSEAYLATVREEAADDDDDDDDGLAFPLSEVVDYLRELRRIPVEVRVFASTSPAAIAFVCRAKAPLTLVEMHRLYERLHRWTGLRIDGCDGQHADRDELVGDSYGTMDWGLNEAVIRQYHPQPVFVFAAARTSEALHAGLAGLDVRPSPDHPVPPPAATAEIAAPDAPPGPAFAELVDAWLAVAVGVPFMCVKIGPETPYLNLHDGVWEYGPRRAPTAHGPAALAAAIAGWRTLAREHGPPDLGSVEISTVNVERGHALRLYGAAIRTIAETCGIDLTPPPGHAVRPSPWAVSIHPETLAVAKVDPFAPIGGLYLDKEREVMKVVTTYWLVTEAGLERLKDKRAAGAHLAAWVVAYGKRTGALPPRTTLDGTTATFAAGKYDVFTLPLSRKLVGADPKAWVAGLGAAPPEEAPPIDEDRAPWRVELAKSGRATCRVCGQLIDADTVRVGSPSEYEGRASWRWHHLACGAPRLRTPEKLVGFAELPLEAAEEVRIALRR